MKIGALQRSYPLESLMNPNRGGGTAVMCRAKIGWVKAPDYRDSPAGGADASDGESGIRDQRNAFGKRSGRRACALRPQALRLPPKSR